MSLCALARRTVSLIYPATIDSASEWYAANLPLLHARIAEIIAHQKKDYAHHAYFFGYPYQSLAILGVFGERGTEERFQAYELATIISRDDSVLDIGCNCGFMAIYSSFRTGCRVRGIDINPYMIEIGNACASFLRLDDRIALQTGRFQEFRSTERFTRVYSFATHWTDDKNYRVDLRDHLLKIYPLLTDDGILVFESHNTDVGSSDFYRNLDSVRGYFEWRPPTLTDKGSRELYLMYKRQNSADSPPAG